MDWALNGEENFVTDPNGFSHLHMAVVENNLEAVQRLVKSNPKAINRLAFNGDTPLYLAVSQKDIHIEIVRILLEVNPTADMLTNYQRILALNKAVINHRLDIVELLAHHKAPVNSVDEENDSALHYAVADKYINEKIVNYLIDEAHIDWSIKNAGGMTALDILMAKKNCLNQSIRLRIIEKLLKLENTNKHIVAAKLLDQAVAANQMIVVKQVLSDSPALLAKTEDLYQYLHQACSNKYINVNIFKLLFKKVVRLPLQKHKDLVKLAMDNKRDDIVSLMMLKSKARRKSLIFNMVIRYIAVHTANFQGFGDDSLFAPPKFYNRANIIKLVCLRACSMNLPVGRLLNLFYFTAAELNQSDKYGWTMLHHAVNKNHLECVRLLLANPNVQSRAETFERETPLFLGCVKHDVHIEIIELLLKRDPLSYRHLNIADQSVLYFMARNRRVDLVELLWSVAQQYNFDGLSVFHIICKSIIRRRSNFEMIASLAKYPIPEKQKLCLLLLSKTAKYELGPLQNDIVLDKLLHIFYAVNGSDQLDVKSVLKVTHQYLKGVEKFCPKFFMYLVKKLPSVDKDDEEIEYMFTKKCSCYYGIRGYAVLAIRAGSLDPGILADASAEGPGLLQCLMLDSVQSETRCSLVLGILRKLIRLNVILFNYEDIARLMGTLCKNLVEEYCYDKHIRALTFIEELVCCGLDIYKLMHWMECTRDPRYHVLTFNMLLTHFKVDCLVMRLPLHKVWHIGLKKSDYLLKYGYHWVSRIELSPYGYRKMPPKPEPFAAPSSLKEICRNKVYVSLRNNLLIGDYWRFVGMLECPESVKTYLKFWPNNARKGKQKFSRKKFALRKEPHHFRIHL